MNTSQELVDVLTVCENVDTSCYLSEATHNSAQKTQLGIYNNRSPTTREDWSFRKYYYNKIPSYCGTNIIFDKNDPSKMSHVGCNRLSCPRCRPKLKNKLVERITEVCVQHDLFRQLVLTCPGKEWRKTHTSGESFTWLNKKWDSFKVLYNRETGKKLHYIKLPRCQKSGYCHGHILIDQYIPNSLIEDLIKRVGLGSNYKIHHMDIHRLGEYLKNDFYKEHEWFIPVGMRHISSSMELLDQGFRKSIFIMWLPGSDNCRMVVFGRHISPQDKYDFIYDVVQNHADRPPPLWFFMECFNDVVTTLEPSVSYVDDIKKGRLRGCVSNELRNQVFQMTITGHLYRVTTKFEEIKYTKQITFKRSTIKPELQEGVIN